jgi:serine/threonine protein kinase
MDQQCLEANVLVGDYRIEGRIGAGGMGVVYRAQQVSLDRVVALKVLGGALSRDSDIVRFQREAQAVARLEHPGIASVLFVGQDRQLCYMAMEYIDGVSLRAIIDRLAAESDFELTIDSVLRSFPFGAGEARPVRFDQPTATYVPSPAPTGPGAALPAARPRGRAVTSREHVRRSCEIVRDAAAALAHAHERRVVHRDIKPENLMLSRQGQVHLIDFGIARFFEDVTVTDTGALVGTPMYMSPEQVTGRLDVDHRTDIYSLGLVLYELLILRRPVRAPNREGILRQIVTKPLPPVSWQNRAVPRDLESVVHKATAKDPDERYQTAAEFAADLQNCLDGKTVRAVPYRYRFDEQEIRSSRPNAVARAASVFFVQGLLGAFLCLKDFSQLALFGNTVLIPSLGLIGLFSVLALYWLFLARGLNAGRRSTNWQAAGACLLGAGLSLYIALRSVEEYDKFRNYDVSSIYVSIAMCYVASAVCSAVSFASLLRREARDWFDLAARLRSERKGAGAVAVAET